MNKEQMSRTQYGIETTATRDGWMHGATMHGWDHEYSQSRPGPFNGFARVGWIGPIQLILERIDVPINYRGTAWAGARIFFAHLPNTSATYCDNRLVNSKALVTHRWNDVDRFNCSGGIAQVTVAIDDQYLTEYLSAVPELDSLKKATAPMNYVGGTSGLNQFKETVSTILEELSENPALLTVPKARELLQRRVLDLIFDAMLECQSGPTRLPPSTRAYIVGRALDYIDAHLADSISIRDICSEIRICPRTLSYAFTEVLGATPKSVLLASRLVRARRELADKNVQNSIQTIAMRWGFVHMGRFAQYYRGAFNERPSDTFRARGRRVLPRISNRGFLQENSSMQPAT